MTVRKLPLLYKLMFASATSGLPLTEKTVIGNPVTFETDIAKPLKSLLIPWTPTQTGSGDPSPQNIRPIVGVDGVNVWHTGKNLFDESQLVTTGITLTDGYYTGTRLAFYNAFGKDGNKFACPTFKENTQYTLSVTGYNSDENGGWFVIHYVGGGPTTQAQVTGTTEQTFSATSNAGKTIDYIDFTYPTAGSQTLYVKDIQLEVGETASEYSPYTGTTYSVTFPAIGKNLFDADNYKQIYSQADYMSGFYSCKYIQLEPNTQYTVSQRAGTTDDSFVLLINNNEIVNREGYFDLRTASDTKTYTTDGTGRLYIGSANGGNNLAYNRLLLCKVQIEKGSTATAYEPYTSTVYGGTLSLLTGSLLVDWISASARWGDITWNVGEDMTQGNLVIGKEIYVAGETGSNETNICNVATWLWAGVTNTTPHFYTGYSGSYKDYVAYVILPNDTDPDTIVTVAAKLKTPLYYAVDPVTLTANVGENNIWTDTNGDNTIKYLKKGSDED